LSGLLAAGITGYIPVIYDPPINKTVLAQSRNRDTDGDGVVVRYDDLPREVRRALDRERGNRDVKRIVHVDKDKREYWRAFIDGRGDNDLVVLINRDGEIARRGRTDIEDADFGAKRGNGGSGVSRDITRDASDRGYDGRGTWVKFNQTPRAVQDALDRERGNADIKQIIRVNSGDETYYRALINDRRGDRLVVLNSRGKLLDESEVGEARLARGRYDDLDDTRSRVRRDYYSEGERVDFDRLPGEVKTAIGREAGSDRVREVTVYSGRGGNTIYRAEVGDRDTRRIIRVDEQGRVFPERDVNTAGGGDRMRFDNLPGDVKSAVGRHSTPDKIESVTRVTRGGRTEYVVVCDDGPTVHTMTFDERGRMIDDQEGRNRG
jgi:hypothetical protein